MMIETPSSALEKFFYYSPDPMFIVSPSGYIKLCNEALSIALGYTAHEFHNRPMEEFVCSDERSSLSRWLYFFFNGKPDKKNIQYRFNTKDGKVRLLEWKKRFLSESGDLYVIAHDITDSKRKKTESEDTRNRLLKLIDLVPHPIFLKDKEGKYILVNQAQANLFCRAKKELLGKADYELITAEEEMTVIKDSDYTVAYQREPVTLPVQTITLTNGMTRVLHTTKVPFCNTSNGEISILGVSMDVTELKLAEDELRRINFELDSFVYRSSHDLKAPLCSVGGLLSLLQYEKSTELREKYIDEARESIRKLIQFISDMTDYARNKSVNLQIGEIDIKRIARECVENLYFMSHANRIEFKIRVSIEDGFYSDENRIRIILMNLLSNAIKYCDPMKERMFIGVNIKKIRKNVTLTIVDNGLGIEPEFQNRVFEMFFRASELSFGSGLGLYIVKQVAEKLRGLVHVHSRYGRGTIFTVVLPDIRSTL